MAGKRGKGEGSVFQRGDGTWAATITVGYNSTGKRIRKTVYGDTKREAIDKLTRLQNQKLDGTLSEESKLTVAEYLDLWLADSVSHPGGPPRTPVTRGTSRRISNLASTPSSW